MTEFTKVTYKKKRKSKTQLNQRVENLANNFAHLEIDFDKEKAIRRILAAKDDLATSDYCSGVKASVREALSLLPCAQINSSRSETPILHKPSTLICFGIGHFASCMISRYQFALVLTLRDTLNLKSIKISEPVLSEGELLLLAHFEIEHISQNIEAKYVADDLTLFYLPHCPKQLSNNLLWANWSPNKLSNCLIIANSFGQLLETNTKQSLVENASYVLKISPHLIEVAIVNCFNYFEIFNDTAIHIFPNETIRLIDEDFWLDHPEPQYGADLEYINK